MIISLDSKAAVDSRPFDQVLMTPTEPSHEPTMTGAYDKDISINTYQHHHKLIIRVPVIVGQFWPISSSSELDGTLPAQTRSMFQQMSVRWKSWKPGNLQNISEERFSGWVP